MLYQLRNSDGSLSPWVPGKCVCVTRNYAAHAAELNNPLPAAPVFFIKPNTALVDFSGPLTPPPGLLHHELELALIIGRRLSRSEGADLTAVAGWCLALDLTLRERQNELKAAGLPWEASKAFARSCPVTPMLPAAALPDPHTAQLELLVNGEQRQFGNTRELLFNYDRLLSDAAMHYTLEPGDLLLTGTPAGVGPLQVGDRYEARINQNWSYTGTV